jgi:alpha-D-xyloside xylohydrolase
MAQTRTFNIRWIDGPRRDAADFDAGVARTVEYSGAAVTVRR